MADTTAETSRAQELRYVYHLVIPNKERSCVVGELMANGILRLPSMIIPTSIEFPCLEMEDVIERCAEAQLGVSGYLVRNLHNGYNRQIEGVQGVEQHEMLLFDIVDDQAALQRPFKWIGRDVACSGRWVPTNGDGKEDLVNELLEEVFTEINGEIEPEEEFAYEAWENMGWYEEVMLWTRKVLEANNMLMTGRIRQVFRKNVSLVMSCEVQTGQNGEVAHENGSDVVFIKASVPSVREAERTLTIRNVVGNIVPEILSIDETGEIMIQRNGGKLTGEGLERKSVINTILRMQSMSVNRISELEAGGILLADSQWIEMNVEGILKHELFDECWKQGGFEEEKKKEQVKKLRSRVSDIQEMCREITRLGLPRTIVHGDLNSTNIGSPLKEEDNMYRFFDWPESFIGNPLHDIQYFLSDTAADSFLRDPKFPPHFKADWVDYEARVRQVYEHWKPSCTLEEMKAVFPLLTKVSDIVTLYFLTQQYDACVAGESFRKSELIVYVQRKIELLNEPYER